jgi:hypothetical protein
LRATRSNEKGLAGALSVLATLLAASDCRPIEVQGRGREPDPFSRHQATKPQKRLSPMLDSSSRSQLPLVMPETAGPENVLITGLPRSGTTMTCWLINKLNDAVALHEPIRFSDYPDGRLISSILVDFIRETRAQLLREGTAPSHAMQGRIESNPISSISESDQQRRIIHRREIVHFGQPMSNGFQLAIKHNAPFTALLDSLSSEYPIAMIIRNPLALLCSWQTVPLPIRDGRLPMGERYDPHLRDQLSTLSEPLHRQIAILDWCFEKYRNKPANHLFKYEDLIATGGRQLASLFPAARDLNVELTSRNRNQLYPLHLCASLASELLQRSQAWREFYTEAEILALANPSS